MKRKKIPFKTVKEKLPLLQEGFINSQQLIYLKEMEKQKKMEQKQEKIMIYDKIYNKSKLNFKVYTVEEIQFYKKELMKSNQKRRLRQDGFKLINNKYLLMDEVRNEKEY